MRDVYSVYEAKARFSEVIRKVREGRSVVVSYRGEPVAEIRPVDRADGGLAQRLQVLEGLGVVVGGDDGAPLPAPVAKRPGALERFLAEREG